MLEDQNDEVNIIRNIASGALTEIEYVTRRTFNESYRDAALHVDDKLSRGVIYRGPCPESFQSLNENDFERFYKRNNISVRIDLRAKKEIDKLPIKGTVIPVKLLPIDPWKYFLSDYIDWESIDILKKAYEIIVFTELEILKNAVELILSNSDATFIHCSAGRDRTGIIIALVQLLTGVSVEGILRGFSTSADIERTEILSMILQKLIGEVGIYAYAEKANINKEQIELLRERLWSRI